MLAAETMIAWLFDLLLYDEFYVFGIMMRIIDEILYFSIQVYTLIAKGIFM